jgi:hypothetical protein
MRPLSAKKSESVDARKPSLEFRLQAAPRYSHVMSAAGYLWRQLNQKQREELLEWRKARGYPWHSPPHRPNFGHLRFLVSAACYEHRHYIGQSPTRMDNFAGGVLPLDGWYSLNIRPPKGGTTNCPPKGGTPNCIAA